MRDEAVMAFCLCGLVGFGVVEVDTQVFDKIAGSSRLS